MTLFRTLIRKTKIALVLLISAILMMITACTGGNSNDYVGIWMGLDESRDSPIVYQYEILMAEDGQNFAIRMTHFEYKINVNHSAASWQASAPVYLTGQLDDKGLLQTDIGTIRALPQTFQIAYGNIKLTRKAKNTEVKLKYVLRDRIKARYPDIAIAD